MADRDGRGLGGRGGGGQSSSSSPERDKDRLQYVGKSHHAAIKEITDRIASSVNQLFANRRPDGRPLLDSTHTKRLAAFAINEKQQKGEQEEVEESDEDSEGEWTFLHFDKGELSDLAMDSWDMDLSKANVKQLLESLKTDERTEVMAQLHSWFSSKRTVVQEEMGSLDQLEGERDAHETEMKKAAQKISNDLDDKEMASFQVLLNFHKVLHKVAEQERQAKAQRKANQQKEGGGREKGDKEGGKKRDTALQSLGADADNAENLELSIRELRERLQEKEEEIAASLRKAEEAGEGTDSGVQANALVELISAQQDEIAALTQRVRSNETRIQTLRAALQYVQSLGGTGGEAEKTPDEAVLQVIEDIKGRVREAKIAELMSKKEAEEVERNAVPDEQEVAALEQECNELKKQLRDIEDQIRQFQQPSDREAELKRRLAELQAGSGQATDMSGEVSMEQAPMVKQKLALELTKVQQENAKLQAQLRNFETLIATAEQTLKTMEEQKQIFLQSVEIAKQALSEQAARVAAEEEEARKQAEDQKNARVAEESKLRATQVAQEKIVKGLKAEDAGLRNEISSLESRLLSLRKQQEDADTAQKDALAQIEKKKKEYEELSAQAGSGLAEKIDNQQTELASLKTENEALLKKIEEISQKLEEAEEGAARAAAEREREKEEKEREAARQKEEAEAKAAAAAAAAAAAPSFAGTAGGADAQDTAGGGADTAAAAQRLGDAVEEKSSEKEKGSSEGRSKPGSREQAPAGEDGQTKGQQDAGGGGDQSAAVGGDVQGEASEGGRPGSARAGTAEDAEEPGEIKREVSAEKEKEAEARKDSTVAGGTDLEKPTSPPAAQEEKGGKEKEQEGEEKPMTKQEKEIHGAAVEATSAAGTIAALAAQIKQMKESGGGEWAVEDLEELLRLQQDNYELCRQIELIEMKIKAVKASKGQVDLALLRAGTENEANVPPENLELRREVKRKQRELNLLRKKWWAERQDPKAVAARRGFVAASLRNDDDEHQEGGQV